MSIRLFSLRNLLIRVRKRALQHLLQKYFSAHYDRLRPGSVRAEKQRASQLQRDIAFKHSASQRNKSPVDSPLPPQSDHGQPNEDKIERPCSKTGLSAFGLTQMSRRSQSDPCRDPFSDTFGCISPTRYSISQETSHPRHERCDIDSAPKTIPQNMIDHPEDVFFPPLQSSEDLDFMDFRSINSTSSQSPQGQIWRPQSDVPSLTTLIEECSSEPGGQQRSKISGLEGCDQQQTKPQNINWDAEDVMQIVFIPKSTGKGVSPKASVSRAVVQSSQSKAGGRKSSSTIAQSDGPRSDPRVSNISSLVGRLSKCSIGEKNFIATALKHFSCSTLSSVASSIGQRQAVTSGQGDHKTNSRDRSLRSRLSSLRGTKKQYMWRTWKSLELPGDFICSYAMNSLALSAPDRYWPAPFLCQAYVPEQMSYCEFCFTSLQGINGYRICKSRAIAHLKAGFPINQVWIHKGEYWVDRFGNTALHLAAALDAGYQEMKDIMEKGVSVHEVNSGGQTFLHLLKADNWNITDVQSMMHHLKQNNFDFDHLDVLGQTFIESRPSGDGSSKPHLPHWLQYVLHISNPTSNTIDVDSIERVFAKQDQSLKLSDPSTTGKRWFSSHGFLSIRAQKSKDQQVTSALLHSLSAADLEPFRYYRDPDGRNCLHIALDLDSMRSLLPDLQSSDNIKAMVRRLLVVGINCDQHDNQGETPLMAHIRSGLYQDVIAEDLVVAGASIEARNLNGESALHIAIQLGNIEATKFLLGHSVNVFARNKGENGVLEIGWDACRRERANDTLYARITACMALVMDAGAVVQPDIFKEWSISSEA